MLNDLATIPVCDAISRWFATEARLLMLRIAGASFSTTEEKYHAFGK